MKTNNVLLIGPSFLYDLIDKELLKEYGVCPIYSYKNGSQGNVQLDEHIVCYEELSYDEFAKIVKQVKPNAIVCYNDNFLLQVAQLRNDFDIAGIGPSEIKKFKMKSQMYKVLENEFLTPKTLIIDSLTTPKLILDVLGEGDYFIKPDNLAGAEGTVHINSMQALDDWLKQEAAVKTKLYVIQKYYNLPLVHCELYIRRGEIIYIQARQYSHPNHMFLKGKIISSFPIEDSNLREKIEVAAKEVARTMNYSNGVMHTEFFLENDDSLIFLETNIRQAGGSINLIHKKRSGLSMETAMILLELDKPLPLKENFSGYG